ncbi:Nramp family divalent metal transporter [Aerococcus sp. 1KP-2016]|uniref:Nramp family divalent metal transporter n=1 Tax=Aerococcus sp. 1KP-2016 TaxID=1981982 RepID=UPI000B991500|nr:Nramp family divalent metal transporter [Aerococcus sp. 1KP-2016]OYQ67043.1 divalent metal cation transporter [Aerococcus sp. 1KP-2016]
MEEESALHHKRQKLQHNVSLAEINGSITVPEGKSFWRTLLAYSGPGALVAVGYMDPGNWSTSITGGQNFQYLLMSVILMSSLIAMLLQYMAAKLGIVTQRDLAQAIRKRTSKHLSFVLWIITELAIMATDIAEVIGAAIALYLLFNIPLMLAVLITVFDVLLLLLLTHIGFRKIEGLVVALIFVILFVFVYQVALSNPSISNIMASFMPTPKVFASSPTVNGMTPLTGALGIIGATIMPHNLFLHSAISQSRKVDRSNEAQIANAVRFTMWDSNIQLGLAFIVNALLLVMGAAVFKTGAVNDPSFFGLYDALSNPEIMANGVLANLAGKGVLATLFAVALLASGQNATITGTLTGQVIMEGFIQLKLPLWVRRLVTRLLAIVPVVVSVYFTSKKGTIDEHIALNNLMNNSQVFLAFALPFSMMPLLMLTNDEKEMGNQFKNSRIVKGLGWIAVILLTGLNLLGLPDEILSFFGDNPSLGQTNLAHWIAAIIIIFIISLLTWTIYDISKFSNKHKIEA